MLASTHRKPPQESARHELLCQSSASLITPPPKKKPYWFPILLHIFCISMPSSRYYKGSSKVTMPLKAASVKKGHGLLFGPAGTTSVKYVVIICTAKLSPSTLPPSWHHRSMQTVDRDFRSELSHRLALLGRCWWDQVNTKPKRLSSKQDEWTAFDEVYPRSWSHFVYKYRHSKSSNVNNAYWTSCQIYVCIFCLNLWVPFKCEQEYEMTATLQTQCLLFILKRDILTFLFHMFIKM